MQGVNKREEVRVKSEEVAVFGAARKEEGAIVGADIIRPPTGAGCGTRLIRPVILSERSESKDLPN